MSAHAHGWNDPRSARDGPARSRLGRQRRHPPGHRPGPDPVPDKRKSETRRYSVRHYGRDTFLLSRPHVIVEHFTGSLSYRSARDTFARDVPDVELHELPGLCAHFIVDRRGVIHQLVSVRLMCRHTVGLNWTAIGIEHVGVSDAGVMGNRRQLAASLRLTRWLKERFGIRTRDVIGHNESLSSPYHHERVAALKHQTHGDFRHGTMQRYRRLLEQPARRERLRLAAPRAARPVGARPADRCAGRGRPGCGAKGAGRRRDPRERDGRHGRRARLGRAFGPRRDRALAAADAEPGRRRGAPPPERARRRPQP